MIEALVKDFILDKRGPGSFDPVAAMRPKLSDEAVKKRLHILELEHHWARVRKHLNRLGRRPEADVLGSILRARTAVISEAIKKAEGQVAAIDHGHAMLEEYGYEMDVEELRAAE